MFIYTHTHVTTQIVLRTHLVLEILYFALSGQFSARQAHVMSVRLWNFKDGGS